MRKLALIASLAAAPALVLAFCEAIRKGLLPTGVPGEWTWNAPTARMSPLQWIPALVSLIFVTGFVIFGEFALKRRRLGGMAVVGLFPAAAIAHIGWHLAAPPGYGLAKWPIATFNAGSSGYYSLARDQIVDLPRFLSDYPEWILDQDVLHTGTHPPGLFVEARLVLDFWSARPAAASGWMAQMPREIRESARLVRPGGISPVEQSSVVSLAIVRWLAGALTAWPIYLLTRRLGRSPIASFRAAALWCVVPSAVVFQPAADLLFPVLATAAVALAAGPVGQARPRIGWFEPFACGLILALGMFFSLVFLAVGFIVAMVVMSGPDASGLIGKCKRISLIGAGFLSGTGAWALAGRTDPVAIWLANQAKHAGFYAAYPRSYWPWLMADLVETAVGIGLPIFAAIVATLAVAAKRGTGWPAMRVAVPTAAVLVLLAVSGRSLSEVGRLWLPFFPLMLTAAVGLDDSNETAATKWQFLWMTLWTGIQLIWLQSLVQCVYPV